MKAQTTSLRCAQKQLPYKLASLVLPGRQDSLYFKGWTPLIIVFCCLSLSAIAPSCSALRARAPSSSYGVDPPPFRCIFRLGSYVLRIRWTLTLKRGGSTPLRDSLTGWACPPTTNDIWGCLKFVSTPFYVVGSPQSSPLGLRWCSAFASHPFGAFFG